MKSKEIIEQKYKKVSCVFCSSNRVIKRGIRKTEYRGKVQRFGCKDCGKRFSIDDGFWKMKSHEKKITLCMDLYYNGMSFRKAAIDFYKYNDIDTKPKLDDELEEEIYRKTREDIKSGKLKVEKGVKIEYVGEKLGRDFYRAKDLNEETKLKAKAQGFKFVRKNELDGTVSGGFYIRKENPRESETHFCLKHLFVEIYPSNMHVEHQIKDKRIDVAYLDKDFMIGIEIETGANREQQIASKIPWLNKHFNAWIFVCKKEHLVRYSKYVDNKKSFCYTPKKAKKAILEYLEPVFQEDFEAEMNDDQ